ncbi:MAG: hypothetical protein WCC06_03780 [Candidatus Aminicenantales bacterium]
MKRWAFFPFIAALVTLLCLSTSCKRESAAENPVKEPPPDMAPLAVAEIDVQRIQDQTGLRCRILKTETLGYTPLHQFYWVCLPEKPSPQRLEALALAIIKETITRKPRVYHSFTIHFFCEKELSDIPERSKSFAQATFLPEGSWIKVGRVPIDDYKDYKLTCTFLE